MNIRSRRLRSNDNMATMLIGVENMSETVVFNSFQEKDCRRTVEVHGVSYVSYKLLLFFYPEVIDRYKEKGCQFDCEEDVLTIQADDKDIKMAEVMIKQQLVLVRDLCKEEVSIEDVDLDSVVNNMNDRYKENVCCIADKKHKKILLFGKVLEYVEKGKVFLASLLKEALENGRLSKSTELLKSHKYKNGEMSNADYSKSYKGMVMEQADARSTVKSTGRSKPAMEKVKIDHIPADLFRVMKIIHSKLFQNFNVIYDSSLEQALIEKRQKDEFEKCLSEVKKLQTEVISIPETTENYEMFDESDQVICIHNSHNSTISVFASDMKSVKDKIHQIKVDLRLVEESRRRDRQFTESLQISDPSDSDEEKSLRAGFQHKGARPKIHSAQCHPETSPLLCGQTFYTNERIPVRVYTKNILHLDVDCIVNAANEILQHGGGIAEVISKAAGYDLNRDCSNFIKRNGYLQTGGVYVSMPGKLDYKCVIHAVGPRWSDYKTHTEDGITKCKTHLFVAVLNSFLEAEHRGMKTIAVPAISSGNRFGDAAAELISFVLSS